MQYVAQYAQGWATQGATTKEGRVPPPVDEAAGFGEAAPRPPWAKKYAPLSIVYIY